MITQIKRLFTDFPKLFLRDGLTFGQKIRIWCNYKKIVLKRFLNNRFAKFYGEKFLGFKVSFDSYDDFFWTYREIFVLGEYHIELDTLKPFMIDCGGNIGITTLYFKFLYPKSRVLTFEAEPHNAEMLKHNLEQSGIEGVEVVNKAVGGKHDKLTFFGGNRAGTIFEEFNEDKKEGQLGKGRKDIENKVEIDLVPLSEYVDQEVDLLKLDIEGAECDTIKDLDEKGILKKIENIAIEYHRFSFEKNKLEDILGSLEKNKFNVAFDSEYKNIKTWLSKKNHAFMIYAKNTNQK